MDENEKTPKQRGRPQKPGNKVRTAITISENAWALLRSLGKAYGLTQSQMLEVIIRDRYYAEVERDERLASSRKKAEGKET